MTNPHIKHNFRPAGLCTPQVRPLIVIPVFNHGGTLREVALRCLEHGEVLVIDDGSTDCGMESINDLPLIIVSHEKNMGKGQAILTAARKAITLDRTHIITIDADGQHFPEDIPAFLAAIAEQPEAIFVGSRNFSGQNIPGSSKIRTQFFQLLAAGSDWSEAE